MLNGMNLATACIVRDELAGIYANSDYAELGISAEVSIAILDPNTLQDCHVVVVRLNNADSGQLVFTDAPAVRKYIVAQESARVVATALTIAATSSVESPTPDTTPEPPKAKD